GGAGPRGDRARGRPRRHRARRHPRGRRHPPGVGRAVRRIPRRPARSRPQGIHLPPRLPRPRPHPHRRRGPVGARGHRHRAARPLRRRGAGMSLIVDVVAVILLAGNVYLGWRLGLFGRMFAFAGFYAGVAAAGFAGNAIERFFHGGGNQSDLWAAGWTFLGVVAAVTLMLEILGALYREKVRGISTLAFDRTAGAIAGVVVAGFEIALVAIV